MDRRQALSAIAASIGVVTVGATARAAPARYPFDLLTPDEARAMVAIFGAVWSAAVGPASLPWYDHEVTITSAGPLIGASPAASLDPHTWAVESILAPHTVGRFGTNWTYSFVGDEWRHGRTTMGAKTRWRKMTEEEFHDAYAKLGEIRRDLDAIDARRLAAMYAKEPT